MPNPSFIPALPLAFPCSRRPPRRPRAIPLKNPQTCSTTPPSPSTYDLVVVGAGLGGLSAAALLSACYNRTVCVLEAHTVPGGAAHEFTRRTSRGQFSFDVGPHLFSGLSSGGDADSSLSANPMQHVLRAVGANLPVIPYKTWGVWLPDGKYVLTKVEPSQPLFAGLMREMGGENAINEVAQLLDAMQPLCRAATALPPAALRAGDLLGTLKVAGRFFLRPELLSSLPYLPALSKPFAPILDKHVKDPFARNFLDLLCFLLAGVTADKIPTAEVAFMFSEWTGSTAGSQQSDSVLEHPVGGAAGIVDALVQVLERHGSILQTKSNVQKVLVEGEGNAKRAVGVQLKSGEKVMAREGVISNVSSWDFPSLFPDDAQESIAEESAETPMCPSFMHLHIAIEMTPEVQAKIPHKLEANYVSVEDWERGITSPDNVVLVSIPTVLEPSRAPQGFAVAHAYTPATEPYESWAGLRPESAEYEAMKAERSKVLWRAVEKIFGQDMRELAHVKLIGTPKTHERFLNRKFGTYGPMVDASESLFTLPLPHKTTAIGGLWSVGDSTFPGIGVPATAASAWLAANAFGQVKDHAAILKGIGL